MFSYLDCSFNVAWLVKFDLTLNISTEGAAVVETHSTPTLPHICDGISLRNQNLFYVFSKPWHGALAPFLSTIGVPNSANRNKWCAKIVRPSTKHVVYTCVTWDLSLNWLNTAFSCHWILFALPGGDESSTTGYLDSKTNQHVVLFLINSSETSIEWTSLILSASSIQSSKIRRS